MNTGVITCLVLAGAFLILGIVFAVLREHGALIISGFNALPKPQQAQYDQARMSRDMRNLFFIWVALFLSGAVLSHFFSAHFATGAFVIWLVMFFKQVHFDTDKAFGKYRL